jgi:hypothetical protein
MSKYEEDLIKEFNDFHTRIDEWIKNPIIPDNIRFCDMIKKEKPVLDTVEEKEVKKEIKIKVEELKVKKEIKEKKEEIKSKFKKIKVRNKFKR